MAEEVSSIGVKLSLNAGSFMSGMTAATEKTEQFVAAAKEAQTVAGKTQGSKSGPGSSGAQRSVAVPVDLTISSAQIRSIREQIIKGIGTISVPITAQLSKAAQNEAKAVMSAVSTPAVGTRSGARVAVESTVARNLPKREYGGSVQANRGVLVGERRPEVFVPRQSGSIHPDASRFYREQETAARREAAAERQHQERMGRIQHARFGLRSVTGSYPNAEVDLSQSSRRDRLRYGDELVSLARQYPHTAQRMKEIRSMPDRPFNLAVDRAYKQPAGTFPPMSTFGMTTGSRKTAPRMLLNASFTDQDVRSMGAVPRNIVEGLRHEYGHAVDFSNSVTQNAFLGPALGKLAPQSKYAKVGPREHFAELFTAYQRGALGGDDKTLFDAVKMIDQKRAGRHGGGYVHAMAGAKVGDIEERLTRVQRSYTANIRSAARRLTPDVTKAGIDWYPGAQDWIGQQALAFGKPEPMVRGMAAALSAGTSWPANKTKLLRILQADASGKPFPYSRALDAHVKAEKMLAGADPWSLLGHTPKTGQFFLNTGGDLDALTIDRWAFRTATRGAVEQQGSGRVRRGADKAFRKVAKEMGIHPVQLQAALWIQEKYDADLAVGKKPDIAKYMARGGAVEGTGEGLFHHHGARPQQGFLRGALSTAGEWLKDPFMAWQAWQGQQGHAAKGARVRTDRAIGLDKYEADIKWGKTIPGWPARTRIPGRPGVDVVGPSMAPLPRQIEGWFDEQGPTGRAGTLWESLFSGKVPGGMQGMAWSHMPPGVKAHHGGGYVHAEEGAEVPQRYRAKSAEEHEAWLADRVANYEAPSEDVVAEAKRIWMTMHARPRGGAYRRADEDAMLKLLIRGGEPWRERTAREAESGSENWTIERAKETLKANAEGPEALEKLVGGGAWWAGRSAVPGPAIEYPEAFKQAFGAYSDLLEEFGPAEEAYRRKFPSREKLSPALLKQQAKVAQARGKFLRIKSQMGFSAPLDAYMHIVGGGWRWAEAEAAPDDPNKQHYGAGQVPGFWTSEEAPFRDLTEASTHARSFITDQRFEGAWQHAWDEGYGGLTAPGYAESKTASKDYYSGKMTRFGGGPPDESAAWEEKYGHKPFGGMYGPSGPFKAGSLGSFPSAAEFKESEEATALHAAGYASQQFPWAEFPKMEPTTREEAELPESSFGTGKYRVAGPWPFDYLNPLETGRYAGAAHDPVWEQAMAKPPASWQPTAQRDYEAERKEAQAAERAKRVAERAEAKAAKKTEAAAKKITATVATKAAREVPQHEAPTVLEHQAVMEAHAEKAIVEAVKETIAEAPAAPAPPSGPPPDDLSLRGLGLYSVASRRTRQPSIEEKLGVKVPWSRAAGGDVGNGLYVVNEMGPEAFIEGRDVGKLRARRPDIYGRIPKAGDGARTGMIDRPSWSMFAPQKDGLIVRREDAHAALGAVHAKDGIITPEHFGDEAEEARKYQRAWSGYSAPLPPMVPARAKFEATGAIQPVVQRTRSAAMEADVAAIKADTAAIMAHAEAARKGSTSLAAGSKQIAGLLEPGPSVIPMGPPATPMGPTMYVPPAGEGLPFTHAGPIPSTRPTVIPMGAPKAATRAADETARAADETASAFEKTGDAWVSIGKGLEAPARVAAVMKASLESGAKRKDLIAMGPHMIRESEGATLGAPSGRTPLAREAIRFGYVSEKARRIREGEPTEMQERLAQLRIRTAGAAAYETARTPRGVAAVLGQLGLGGGQQYKVNQALLQNARIAANVTGAQVLGLEKEVGARKQSLAFLKDAGATEEDTAPIVQELAQQESSLADARKHHKVNLGELDKAEKAVLPTASNVIKSFGAIILSTSLYGAAFSAASMLIDKAAIPAMGRWVDQMTGWQATSTKVTSALGEQVYASHGNIAAVMAQTAANAGLSKSMMDYVGNAVEASAFAKAGAKAQGEASDLFRTAIRGGPPEGLYSGYGGILGTPLLGTEMGGGRGLTETISQDLKMLAGGRGKASADFPFIGNPANAQQNLGGGIDLLLDRDYRDYITGKGKQQGGFQGAVSTAIEIPGGVGDVLGGLGDAISSLNPFGQNFGATFLGGMKNAQGVPYAGSAPSGGTYGGRGGAFGGARGAAGRGVAAGLGSTRDMAAAETAATAYHPLAMLGTPDEQKGVTNYLEDLNKAIDRGATAAAHGTTGHYRLAKSQEEATKAEYAAIQAHDKNGIELAKQGVVLEDNAHTVVDNGKAYQAINEDLARGKTTVDEAVRAGLVTRQLQATQQANAIQTQRAINVELPFETTKQLLTQPIIKPGAGFFPGAGRGQPSAAAAGLSGGAARAAQSALSQTADANQQLQDIAKQGLAAARADITQFTPENLPDFNAAVKQAQGLSNSIASLTTHMASLNRAASQASWANQIRIATRALGDAIAMEGKAGGTRLGMLERESHFIERAQQALSLALEQRQITTKVALAGFQAPGETGEERYMRQKEQLAEAAIQQKQLNLSKQDFAVAGQSWVENVKRSAVDAAKAIEVMQKARDAEGYTIAAQEAVAKKEQLLANVVGKMDSLIGQARGNFNAVLQSAAGGVAEFGGAVDVAVREIYKSLGYKQDSRGNYYKPATDTATGGGARRPSMGYMGRHAAGYAGAATGGGAMFTVGEAGPETVAILRNPRTHMIQGEGGGGGGGAPVTVNINGPVVREDKDIAELARCVAEEVERTLSRKGQLLGLRSPAY